MKKISVIKFISVCSCVVMVLCFSGCKKLLGLPLQENVDHPTTTIDPHINKTAWDFIRDRALVGDTIFKLMYQGILYAGIDSAEYKTPGRTFIVYHNDAILRKSGTTVQADCYFGKYKVNGAAASSWNQYPQAQVKNHLLSLIVKGEYSFENVPPDPVFATTFMPANADPLNPESKIAFRVINDRDSRFRINDFPGSAYPSPGLASPGLQARTAGILSTNGPIHVVDRVVFYQTQ
ncbi:MAG: hypothetical protein JO301_13015 [Chitinophagaceae bacterium]|nr:hypothetical protein [Chitinophagaceae bacterium]